jgi:hypothetical protein
VTAPGIPWRTWTPEAERELRESGRPFLAWAAELPWLVRFSKYDNRFVLVLGLKPKRNTGDPDLPMPNTPFGDPDTIEAFCRLTPPAEVGEAERLLPVRLVPRGHPVGDAP